MKIQKYKTIARLNFSGFDDLNYSKEDSVYKIDFPTSDEDKACAKLYKFKIDGIQDIRLSKHSKLIIESCFIPNVFDNNQESYSFGPFQVRCRNIGASYCYDSSCGNNGAPLMLSGNFKSVTNYRTQTTNANTNGSTQTDYLAENDPRFQDYDEASTHTLTTTTTFTNVAYYQEYDGFHLINPYPEILYNFDITQSFLNSPYFEFEVIYIIKEGYAGVPIDATQDHELDKFQLSLIIQDVDEEELLSKDTKEVDWKNWGPHFAPRKGL
jgi:hypothetical protein